MKNYFFLILISLIFFSCKNKENDNSKTEIKEVKLNIETKAIEEKIESTEIKKESSSAEKRQLIIGHTLSFLNLKSIKNIVLPIQ